MTYFDEIRVGVFGSVHRVWDRFAAGEVMPRSHRQPRHSTRGRRALRPAPRDKVLQPHLDDLFQRVMFPVLCFNAEDDELWVDDPHEYVRKSQDFIEDMYPPGMAATWCTCTNQQDGQAHEGKPSEDSSNGRADFP